MTSQEPENILWVRRVAGPYLSTVVLDRELNEFGAEIRYRYGSHRAIAIELSPDANLAKITEVIARLGWEINRGYIPESRPCDFCHGNGYRYSTHFVTSEHNPKVNELFGSGQRVMYYKKHKEPCHTCRGTGELFG